MRGGAPARAARARLRSEAGRCSGIISEHRPAALWRHHPVSRRPALALAPRRGGRRPTELAVTTPSFEQGPIRPPSEAHSLLVRVIRNCTWNRCTFCPVYKGTKSSLRPLDDVLADVDAMAAAAEVLAPPRHRRPARGRRAARGVPGVAVPARRGAVGVPAGRRPVRRQAREARGGRCAVSASASPRSTRVTTYGRARTLARRTPEQLALLADAGLTRVHLGLESGADEVLMAIDKGCTAAELVAAGEKVLGAGLELCFYFMPGLGGREVATAHVRGTAARAARGRRRRARRRPPGRAPAHDGGGGGHAAGGARGGGRVRAARRRRGGGELRELLSWSARSCRTALRPRAQPVPRARRLAAGRSRSAARPARRVPALAPGEQAEFALGVRLGVYRSLDDTARPRPPRA